MPDCEVLEFANLTDLVLALKEGKIDFFVNTTIVFEFLNEQNPDFGYLDEELYHFDVVATHPGFGKIPELYFTEDYYFIFSKDNSGLRDEFNEWLAVKRNEGYLDEKRITG